MSVFVVFGHQVNNEDKVYLQDVQQRRIPSHGSRVVRLELRGPGGRVECKVKFDVADVAYPVCRWER